MMDFSGRKTSAALSIPSMNEGAFRAVWVMERVVANRKTQIHGHHATIVGWMTIPFPVKTNDDVTTVSQCCAEVYLLTSVLTRHRWLRSYIATP